MLPFFKANNCLIWFSFRCWPPQTFPLSINLLDLKSTWINIERPWRLWAIKNVVYLLKCGRCIRILKCIRKNQIYQPDKIEFQIYEYLRILCLFFSHTVGYWKTTYGYYTQQKGKKRGGFKLHIKIYISRYLLDCEFIDSNGARSEILKDPKSKFNTKLS